MRLLLSLIVLVSALARVSAQETFFRHVTDTATDTHVELTSLFSEPSRGGYLPVRVKLSNNLKSDLSARIAFHAELGFQGRVRSDCSYGFAVPAGKTVTQDILVPLCPSPSRHTYGDQVRVSATLTGGFGKSSGMIDADTADLPCVLLSQALFTANSSRLDAEVASLTASRYGGNRFAASFLPAQLPSEWLAYSGYDCLLISEAEWSAVPAGARNAIFSWVRLGGRLIIFTSGSSTAGMLGLPEDPGFGSTSVVQNLTLSGSGTMGSLEIPPKETVEMVKDKPPVQPLAEAISSNYPSSWPLQDKFGIRGFHYGLFIVVLIAFSILVGPVNLFVFAKSGRRHRLFLTTPIISLGASLLLVALIIFQDGFGGNGERRVLMEVRSEAGENAAYIHQEQFSRTGILLGDEFTVDPASFITPVPIARSRWSRYTDAYDSSGDFDLQPGGGKLRATGDWWQSRSEHGHIVSSVVPTRGRIEATQTADTFVSTFEFPIDRFFYQDKDGNWFRASDVETGRRFTVTPVEASVIQPELAAEANAFTYRHRRMLESAGKRRDHYVAITDSAPGIATHPGIRWKQTRTVITGPIATP